jgi:hypothetical protein
MGVRLAATTPTACDDAVIRTLVAIELSKKSWIVGANDRAVAASGRPGTGPASRRDRGDLVFGARRSTLRGGLRRLLAPPSAGSARGAQSRPSILRACW